MQSIRLSTEHIQAMVDHANTEYPNEVCGIIVGVEQKAKDIISIANVADKPEHHYEMNASQLWKALQQIENSGGDWIGIYHSHPHGEPIPSIEDIKAATINTPNMAHVIISLKHQQIRLKAWQICAGQVEPIQLLIGQQKAEVVPRMTKTQVWAVVIAVIISMGILLALSFSLLPPAPPIPTPQ